MNVGPHPETQDQESGTLGTKEEIFKRSDKKLAFCSYMWGCVLVFCLLCMCKHGKDKLIEHFLILSFAHFLILIYF